MGRNHCSKKCRCAFDTVLCSDLVGGCWFISDGTLWHLLKSSLRRLYDYPNDVEMAADGIGGIWVLDEENLYHCTKIAELRKHTFSTHMKSKLATDGIGGVWVLTDGGLWHCSKARKVFIQEMPIDTEICADGVGGCWCVFDGFLHLVRDGLLKKKYPLPSHADIESDGVGGVWALFDGWVWHCSEVEGYTAQKLADRMEMSIQELRQKACLTKKYEFRAGKRIIGCV